MPSPLNWPVFLGGSAAPTGLALNFIAAPFARVIEALTAFRSATGSGRISVDVPHGLWDGIHALDPMEAPWTVETLIDCGAWTAYLNNGLGGGDPTASADEIARQLETRCVMAMHAPRHGPGHAATQLWVSGPDGVPPLMSVRTLAVHATDGRWSFHQSGTPQPWEDVDRYQVRVKRHRLDRDLLVRYLAAMDIAVDSADFYGDAVVIRSLVDWPIRKVSVAEWRAEQG